MNNIAINTPAETWKEIDASRRRMKAATVGDLEGLVLRAINDEDGDLDTRIAAKDALLELTLRAQRSERASTL